MSDDTTTAGNTRLPPGVSALYVDSEGQPVYHLDPFLSNMKWEGVTIDSAGFRELPNHERLYQQGRAFLHAAIVVCNDAGEAGAGVQWPQGSVCYYCLHLATELFLKACIDRATSQSAIAIHDVAELLRRYRQSLAGRDYYFPTPWFLSAGDLAGLFGRDVLHGVDRTPSQLYRYGSDRKGAPSGGIQSFTPGYLFNYLVHIERRWAEIWAHLDKSIDIAEVEGHSSDDD